MARMQQAGRQSSHAATHQLPKVKTRTVGQTLGEKGNHLFLRTSHKKVSMIHLHELFVILTPSSQGKTPTHAAPSVYIVLYTRLG